VLQVYLPIIAGVFIITLVLMDFDKDDLSRFKKAVRPDYLSDLDMIAKKKFFDEFAVKDYSHNYKLNAGLG